jgi:predicted DNA-binding WGR domain protein
MERVKRRRRKTTGQEPIQLPLFPESASLSRIRPALNEWRYYRLEIWPDLFGGALLMRHWGRIGTAGRQRLDVHSDAGAAVNALAAIVRAKSRRGYRPRAVP